jgi:hypothetical protein
MQMLIGVALYLAGCIACTYAAWRMRQKRGVEDSLLKYFLLWGLLSPFNLLWEYLIGREPDPRIAEQANAQSHKQAKARMRTFRLAVRTEAAGGVGLCATCTNYEPRYGTCKVFRVGVQAHVVECKRFADTG